MRIGKQKKRRNHYAPWAKFSQLGPSHLHCAAQLAGGHAHAVELTSGARAAFPAHYQWAQAVSFSPSTVTNPRASCASKLLQPTATSSGVWGGLPRPGGNKVRAAVTSPFYSPHALNPRVEPPSARAREVVSPSLIHVCTTVGVAVSDRGASPKCLGLGRSAAGLGESSKLGESLAGIPKSRVQRGELPCRRHIW